MMDSEHYDKVDNVGTVLAYIILLYSSIGFIVYLANSVNIFIKL